MAQLNKIQISSKDWTTSKADVLTVSMFKGGALSSMGRAVDRRFGKIITKAVKSGDFKGKSNETLLLFTGGSSARLLLIGLGERKELTVEKVREAGGTMAKVIQSAGHETIASEVPGLKKLGDAEATQAFVEGAVLGSYRFLNYKTVEKDAKIVKSLTIVEGGSRTGLKRGKVIAQAVCLARDLAAHPSNVATPSRLAREARRIARSGGMTCKVLNRDQFTKMGMGAFASVARGADEPPKFILMEYRGGKKGEKPFAFVGKGITFDTGGISIKPSSKMDEMKYDMCGAAAVLGIMQAVAGLKPKGNIIAAIAATENMPGGRASKPGDIVKAYNGKTIEILNTDAEGRLVLADALSYLSKHHTPAYMVNFATLTGAVIVALGHVASAVMGTDEKLIKSIIKAGEATGERAWELPLWDEYCDDVKSKIADVKNLGAPGQAGTIAGGAFLKAFVGDIPWAHLDIAGTAWWNKDRPYVPSGPSGVGVRLSLELLNILG
ncbi:MAG: leucyl aminopeptidase [Candidatus Marinimicrobia bacterium]|nr:leucyl aminopeptidase [Candidatus Neomarinimicrobiota bacterium]|tara:strand:- start:70 stop:1551 length:1482 start_codon:yes stop_codon:yes gene_type:complete